MMARGAQELEPLGDGDPRHMLRARIPSQESSLGSSFWPLAAPAALPDSLVWPRAWSKFAAAAKDRGVPPAPWLGCSVPAPVCPCRACVLLRVCDPVHACTHVHGHARVCVHGFVCTCACVHAQEEPCS